jgi:hypothetical protein
VTGQIPKYGDRFRRVPERYTPDRELASRSYVLRADSAWSIRSDKTSERWHVYWHGKRVTARPFATMRDAMAACAGAHAALTA